MHASTCPLLWWWDDDSVTCSMFRFFQNCLHLSETYLPPVSDIIFFVKLYSEKSNFHASIKFSVDLSSVFFMTGNLL